MVFIEIEKIEIYFIINNKKKKKEKEKLNKASFLTH